MSSAYLGPETSACPGGGPHCYGFTARSQPFCTAPQQAPEGKGRGTRSSGPQRPHSFSEASRRPASVGSDGLSGDADASKDNPAASTAFIRSPKFPPPLDPSYLTLDFCVPPHLHPYHPAPGAVKRKPWTSLSSESVSCPQGSLSPADSLIQVSWWGFLLPCKSTGSSVWAGT